MWCVVFSVGRLSLEVAVIGGPDDSTVKPTAPEEMLEQQDTCGIDLAKYGPRAAGALLVKGFGQGVMNRCAKRAGLLERWLLRV